MKKSVLIMCLLLGGCSLVHLPEKKIEKNPQCASFEKEINIFSVHDNFLLGSICKERTEYGACVSLQVIRLPREKGVLYYDNLTIQVPAEKCMAFVDVYSYTAQNNIHRSVPVVQFVDEK